MLRVLNIMADNNALQLKNLESEKIIEAKIKEGAGEAGKIEVPPPVAEKEIKLESRQEKIIEKEGGGTKEQPKTTPPAGLIDIGEAAQAIREREKEVGKILEAGMEEIYLSLPADKQAEFKAKGEETIREINSLLGKAKFKVEKIISLIRKWLSLIPGVNKFFLEQEAKIKADEIIKLRER